MKNWRSIEQVHLTLAGRQYVVLPRGEYDQLAARAKAAENPPFPSPGAKGNYPAVEYARASIARAILSERLHAGLTQRELAGIAGVRAETLCRIEKGRNRPNMATVAKIQKALRRGTGKRRSAKRRSAG